MSNVIKKKKKTLLDKLVAKVKTASAPHEPVDSVGSLPFCDYSTEADDAEAAAIALRRDELRASQHGNTDATVTIRGRNANV
jgi:hypothetical protein